MIDAPAAYTGRRRAARRSAPLVLAAALFVAAAVFLTVQALPDRGRPPSWNAADPVVPVLSLEPPPPATSPALPPSTSPPPSPSSAPSSPTARPSKRPAKTVVSVEAESARRSGRMAVREVRGASGGRVVTGVGDGRALAFGGVSVPAGGEYRLTIAYLPGGSHRCYIGVGRRWSEVALPAGGRRDAVATVTLTVRLAEGRNTVEAGNTPGRWCPDLDRITVTRG